MKKRILVSCFICVLLILGSFCASAPHSAYAAESYDVVRTTENLGAQKKGTLNITSVTLYKGESVVLEVNGLPEGSTVSFTSSSKKKASVDAKTGRIKALKKGSATITASVSVPSGYGHDAYSYTLKCKVKVKNGSAKSISSLAQLKSVLTNGKGGRYKLTADISGLTHITIPSGTYRLNLNGHKISGKSAAADGSLIEVAGGDLIITDTKGNGIINTIFDGYEPYKGDIEYRQLGSLIAFETGESVTYGLFSAQDRGSLFIGPGEKVYSGMVIGSCSRAEDIEINVCKKKHLTNTRSSSADEALTLTPPRILSLEQAIDFIDTDELLEVTPKSLRIRKRILDPTERKRAYIRNKS